MGRTVSPGGRPVNGRNVAEFSSAVFAEYGSTCHLCGKPGAATVDHLVPVSQDPSLRWEISNCRPAHEECNFSRGDAPLSMVWQAQGW